MDNSNVTGLEELIGQLARISIPESTRKEAIIAAAETYSAALIQNTREAIKTPSPNKKTHLWEDVSYKKGQYPDGSVDVGFNKYGYYYRYINNGTKNIKGEHFVEHTYDQMRDKMQVVMVNKLQSGMKS